MNFGIIGFGEHAKTLLGSFSRASRARLSHLGTLHPEKTEFVRRKLPQVSVAGSYDGVLQSEAVDAVIITLPNHLHAEWSERALDAKKHVLCEKPVCLDPATARRLADKSKASGLLLAEAFYYRQHPQHKTVKKIVCGGALGQIQRMEVQYHYTLRQSSNFRLKAPMGGGALFDTGCYGVDSARFYFGAEPNGVEGRLSLDQNGVDHRAYFELSFPNGGTAAVSCSMDGQRESSLKLFGSGGIISMPQAFHVQALQKVSVAVQRSGEPAEILPQPAVDQYAAFIDLFAEAAASQSELPEEFENGVRNMTVLDQVRRECARLSL